MSTTTSAVDIKSPFLVRMINGVGGALNTVGLTVPHLDEEKFLADARKKTGLQDFGDEGFRDGLRVLLHSLKQDANLNTMGRVLANQQTHNLLCNRLKMVDFQKKHSEIAQQEIKKPLFIVGLPRTGTTILQNLLAQDPVCRSPLSWETAQPCPPVSGPDKRIADSDKELDMLCKLIPGFEAIHPVGAELPQECISMMALNFTSIQFELNFDIPSYTKWYQNQNLIPTYEFHKQFLQLLNYCNPGDHWVLKTPGHLGAIDAILAVYPDACIIQTHRNPSNVLPSTASLYYALRDLCTDTVDPVALGNQQIDYWSQQLEAGIKAREALPQHAHQFYDMHFTDLMNDPFGAIENIYKHFDMNFTPEAKSAMQAFLADNTREKHGKHHYTAEMYGMTEEHLTQAFKHYCDYFGIERSSL